MIKPNKMTNWCTWRRLSSASESAQSDQSPCYPHEEKFGPKQSIESTVNIGSVTTLYMCFRNASILEILCYSKTDIFRVHIQSEGIYRSRCYFVHRSFILFRDN